MNQVTKLLQNGWVRLAVGVVVAAILVILPLVLPVFANQTLTRIGVYAVAVLGLNIIMGYSGQVMLGQIFFLGVGAYVTAYGVGNDWNVVVVFLAACVIPGILGLIIALAAARLGGLAIAMVTIALPIIGVPLAKRLSDLTGGSQGVSARFSSAPEWTGLDNDQWQYYIVVGIAAVAFVLAFNLVRGKYGRAMAIVRDNESVARSMGISPYRYKVMAFTVASIFGGVSGFLYMVAVQYTSPETMSFHHSISLLAAMVVGGAASIAGSLIGGAYYVLVPQVTNAIDPTITAISQGIILVAVLFVLPGGIVSLPRVIRRLLRRRGTPGAASTQTTPPPSRDAAPTTEGPETERQGQA
ncbi:branched-chain amino acid ABC transporter permease [Microbacterium invictum]|uniref:Branched-chain amino acid transport system permease protein n=1 Tax=Microbacterium invictum TaxID=515415 RepID=A0AA40SR90_9MICO|nr:MULTISPECIES: branched-chain amino acid ABC transporter permease [Microbacterium]MBB4140960.1 branched-chain amino acid transport system permease protein [Microbacterium invictum]